jgi:carboxymethylenebutenolidase
VRTGTVTLSTLDGDMPVYEAIPDDPRGAVIVFQEAYGVNDYIEDVARRLADEGYHAVAPHLFHRAGGGVVPYGDIPKAIEKITTLDDDGLLADVEASVEWLRKNGFVEGQIGCVGFCMGGRVTFLVAARRTLGAAAGFYGGGIVVQQMPGLAALIGEAPALATPWLGLFGDEDGSIPVDHVEQLREALREAPVETQIVRYAEAGHGFHSDRRDTYVPDAAADAWRRTLDFFARHLGAPSS